MSRINVSLISPLQTRVVVVLHEEGVRSSTKALIIRHEGLERNNSSYIQPSIDYEIDEYDEPPSHRLKVIGVDVV